MKRMLLLALLPLTSMAAEIDHSAHTAAVQPAPVEAQHDHAAMTAAAATTLPASSMFITAHEHGGMLNQFLMAERFERQQQDGDDVTVWDAQGWLGGDYHKLWLKTEGSWLHDTSEVDHGEVQLLYSRAVAPFWDLQAGLRYDDGNVASRSYAVFGVQGLAPYWFEVDAAAFINEESGLQLRVEAEYDLRLTQKLFLQPRLQLNHAFDDDKAGCIRQGLSDSNIALRLRYEVIREFAPYVGVEQDIGGHRQPDELRLVAGVRFWY